MEAQTIDDGRLKALVRQAQEGDRNAFGEVYDLCFGAIYRYVAFRLPPEAAEDVAADIFVKAWEKLGSYKPQDSVPFLAWLFRIARHAVIDIYRQDRRFEEMPEDVVDEDELNRADTALKRKATILAVRAAVEKLPGRYRDVLMLSFIGGLPGNAVARLMHTSEGGVRVLKLRALRKLESLLPPDLDPGT
ncbi:MAG: sigma-70 family RNA polymerase sigma factor [Candidatus Peribacteraceae bacterium]|nr:sigma-70 family RNA polymerase sigma factor [Candidatus Peribacteraceae bacterium]